MSAQEGILGTIALEHERIAHLLAEVEELGDSETESEKRARLYRQLRSELLAHAAAEVKALYAPLKAIPEARVIVANSEGQSEFLEEDVLALDRMSPRDPDWHQRLAQLSERIAEHVEDVEGELFLMAQDVLSAEELEELDDEFQMEKEREFERVTEPDS